MALAERGKEMIIIVAVLVALASLAVLLRVYVRLKLHLGFAIDDYLCFATLFFLYGMLVELVLWCTIGGNGSHAGELDAKTLLNFGKIFLANQFTYFVLCPLLKISIICFYQRIFQTPRFRFISTGVICLIALWGAGIFLACALQCRPLRGYWDKSVGAKCFNEDTFFIVNQAFNVVMDFVILGLPLPIIWGLKRAWQDKLALSGVFTLGGFVCFASIYRIVVLFFITPDDTTYTVYQATLWTHIEPSVGLICACLPSIRGLFPVFKFSGSRTGNVPSNSRYGTASKNDNSHLVSNSYRGNSEYIKMYDTAASKAGTEEGQSIAEEQDMPGRGGIIVRTEIHVMKDQA